MIYEFSADRQLFFYVNIEGQQRLVCFGERNSYGASVFQTQLAKTAEAIRKHSLFKRGVIKEMTREDEANGANEPNKANEANGANGANEPNRANGADEPNRANGADENVLEAKNFTQAKSMLAKKLGIGYNDIKTPMQLDELAKNAGLTIIYTK